MQVQRIEHEKSLAHRVFIKKFLTLAQAVSQDVARVAVYPQTFLLVIQALQGMKQGWDFEVYMQDFAVGTHHAPSSIVLAYMLRHCVKSMHFGT